MVYETPRNFFKDCVEDFYMGAKYFLMRMNMQATPDNEK